MASNPNVIFSPDTNIFILAVNEHSSISERAKNYFKGVEKNPRRTRILQSVQRELNNWIRGIRPSILDFFSKYKDGQIIDDFLDRCNNPNPKSLPGEKKYLPYVNVIKSIVESNIDPDKEKIRAAIGEIKNRIDYYLIIFDEKKLIRKPAILKPEGDLININDPDDEKHLYLISHFLKEHHDIESFYFISQDKKHLVNNKEQIVRWNKKIKILTLNSESLF